MSSIFAQRLIKSLALSACPRDAEESAYKELVGPVLGCGNSVWDPK